jgi:uncharacterized protein (TIGR02147 family)
MKPIFEYINYRTYLKDFYAHQKETKKHFSYRYFAQKAELSAPILLKLVIDGKRNLTRATIEKFILGLNLKEKEAVYFRSLVLFNQATSSIEKQEHYRALQSMVHLVPQHVLEDTYFDYFDKWYYSAIREGVCQFDYRDEWSRIANCVHPAISPTQAHEAVRWLLSHDLLRKLPEGRYEQVHTAIASRAEVQSMVMRNFNRTMIKLAEQSLDTFPIEERYAAGITIGLNREAYDIIIAEIDAFRDRIVKLVDSLDETDRVYQVNLQLFPLMVAPEEKK